MNLDLHRNALLEKHRCGYCAEAVPAVDILRKKKCMHCDQVLLWVPQAQDGSLYEHLKSKWSGRRWFVLIVVFISSLFFGQIPMLQSIIMVLALIFVHLFLIRKALNWFSLSRRIPAKITIQLLASLIAVTNLILNALVALIPILGGVFLSIMSIANLLIFIHGSLYIIRKRLTWEENNIGVGLRDWLIPGLFFSLIAGFFLCVGASFYVIIEFLDSLNVGNIFKSL